MEHKPTEKELKSKYSYVPPYDYVKTGKLHFGIDTYRRVKRKNWCDGEAKKRKIKLVR